MVTPTIRLLAVDIDGTLLNPQFQISGLDLRALQRAHEMGVEVVIFTGRRHQFALPVVEQLGFDLWIVSSNGAVTRHLDGTTFHRDLLPTATCRKLCAAMKDFRDHAVITFDKETHGCLVLESMNQLESSIQRWLEKNLQYIQFVVPIEDALTENPVQAMYCGSIPLMQKALAALNSSGLDHEITVLRTEYPHRDLMMVDVLNQGCSKGHALERWAAHRGIPREQVMAIGDNYNDFEMLAFAGVPVIMGNASAELRGQGWLVTLPNDQNGVAEALEKIVFSNRVSVP